MENPTVEGEHEDPICELIATCMPVVHVESDLVSLAVDIDRTAYEQRALELFPDLNETIQKAVASGKEHCEGAEELLRQAACFAALHREHLCNMSNLLLDLLAALDETDHEARMAYLVNAKEDLIGELEEVVQQSTEMKVSVKLLISRIKATRDDLLKERGRNEKMAQVKEYCLTATVGTLMAVSMLSIPLIPITAPVAMAMGVWKPERNFFLKRMAQTFKEVADGEQEREFEPELNRTSLAICDTVAMLNPNISLALSGFIGRGVVKSGARPFFKEEEKQIYDKAVEGYELLMELLQQQKRKWADIKNLSGHRIDLIQELDFSRTNISYVERMRNRYLMIINRAQEEVTTQQTSLERYMLQLEGKGFRFSLDPVPKEES